MLKAVITDDEVRILNLLKRLVDWKSLDIEIVAEATNGMEALSYVKEFKPDILITDIKIPVMDGIELTKRVHATGLDVSIVIISGHKQFEYAHSALKYGVVEYLVKPINKVELEKVLLRICEEKKKKANTIKRITEIKRQNTQSAERLRKHFLLDCFEDRMTLSAIDEINSQYCFAFKPGAYAAMLLHLVASDVENIDSHILSKVNDAIRDFFKTECVEFEADVIDDLFVMAGNFDRADEPHVLRQMEKCSDMLHQKFEIYADLKMTMVVGNVVETPSQLPEQYVKLRKLLSSKCALGSQRCIMMRDFDLDTDRRFLDNADKLHFANLVEKFAVDELGAWINEKYMSSEQMIKEAPWMAFEGAKEIIMVFSSVVILEDSDDAYFEKAIDELLNTDSIPMLKKQLTEKIATVLKISYEEKKRRESQPIRLAKAYVDHHLSKPITVEDVANAVNLSYTYFSSLFKKEVGISVSQYMLNKRVDKAKMYLKETTMNLSEIADAVGYSDPKHFSKMFAKVTGITIKEYKRLYS